MFESLTAVGILIGFLLPGYLWRATEGQLIYVNRSLPWEKFAFGLLARSAVVYLPWSPFLYRGYTQQQYESSPWLVLALCVAIAIIEPILCGAFWGRFRQLGYDRHFFSRLGWKTFEQHHAPTAWDGLFSNSPERWIVVTLKGGDQVKGWFGEQSHASHWREIVICSSLMSSGNERMEQKRS